MIKAEKSLRLANFFIDSCAVVIVYFGIAYIVYFMYPVIAEENSLASDILFCIVVFCYYFLLEHFLGKTLGKMVTKTVVRDKAGNKPKPLNMVIRTLIRFIPIEGISFLFGDIGLHDLLSKTTVVKIQQKGSQTV